PLRFQFFESRLKAEIEHCTKQWKAREETNSARFAIFKGIPWKLATTFRLANSQLPVRSPFLDNEVLRLACVCSASILKASNLASSLIRRENPKFLVVPTDRGESGENSSLAKNLRRMLYSATFKLDYLLFDGTPDVFTLFIDAIRIHDVVPFRHRYLDY